MERIIQNKYAGLFFNIPISILYVVFFTLLVNYVMNKKDMDDMCTNLEGDPYWACREKQKKLEKDYEKKHFSVMMIIGLIGIVVGVYLYNTLEGKFKTAGVGTALGGVFTLVTYIVKYWSNIQDLGRIIIIGFILSSLVGGSYYMLN